MIDIRAHGAAHEQLLEQANTEHASMGRVTLTTQHQIDMNLAMIIVSTAGYHNMIMASEDYTSQVFLRFQQSDDVLDFLAERLDYHSFNLKPNGQIIGYYEHGEHTFKVTIGRLVEYGGHLQDVIAEDPEKYNS